jgi:hypothetical protein
MSAAFFLPLGELTTFDIPRHGSWNPFYSGFTTTHGMVRNVEYGVHAVYLPKNEFFKKFFSPEESVFQQNPIRVRYFNENFQ